MRNASILRAGFVLAACFGVAPSVAWSESVTVPNNTPGFIKNAKDLGPVDPTTVITVTAWLKLHNENQLDQLVKQQYTNGHPNFHSWITQDEFNAQFAPTTQEVRAVQNWLNAHNLNTLVVAENNFFVKVQGTVADVQRAFHVQIDSFSLGGATFRSNTANPSVNAASGNHIAAITGLDDFGFQPKNVRPVAPDGTVAPLTPIDPGAISAEGVFFERACFRGVETHTFTNAAAGITATYSGNRFGADITNHALGHLPPCGYSPGDIQTAYNLKSLYSSGLDGTGQTIVITDAFGSATIRQDAEVFSQINGLPDLTPANFQIFRAPGAVNNPFAPSGNWHVETTLDVERAQALAPGANIALVI